ncbi:hypothetical protein BB558_007357 [Smittium angustum]|uniref:Uncharacterized protein n=1 Tax=Smittium angustum TaxID=133377 RepID=A0A2U1IV93_SMIAN|nr:hypothetical protein BB558_007357 [Smittium angustum]
MPNLEDPSSSGTPSSNTTLDTKAAGMPSVSPGSTNAYIFTGTSIEHEDESSLEDLELLIAKGFGITNFEEFLYSFEYISTKLENSSSLLPNTKSKIMLRATPNLILEKIGPHIYSDAGVLADFSTMVTKIRNKVKFLERMGKLKREVATESSKKNFPVTSKIQSKGVHFSHTKFSLFKTELKSNAANPPNNIQELMSKMNAMTLAIKRIEDRDRGKQSSIKSTRYTLKCAYCYGGHAKRECKDLDKMHQSVCTQKTRSNGKLVYVDTKSPQERQEQISVGVNSILNEEKFINLVRAYTASRGKNSAENRFVPYKEALKETPKRTYTKRKNKNLLQLNQNLEKTKTLQELYCLEAHRQKRNACG